MNNREFSVKVNLITNEFKKKASGIKQYAKEWADGIKKDLSVKPSYETTFGKDTSYKAHITQTKQKLQDLISQYNMIEKMKPYVGQKRDLQDLDAEIEKTTNDLNSLNEKQSNVGSRGAKLFNNGIKDIKNNLSNATKKIKRYALSILSLRSAYSLISKAASSYLSTDETRNKKISDAWTTLGAVLVPIIDMITSAIQSAVYYINYFITQLTGVDYVARAMASYSKNASKTTKEMQKNLAGFDEINDISSSSGSSGGSANSSNPFSWMDDFEPNQNVLDFIKSFAQVLKDLWGWLDKNKEWLGLVAIAIAGVFGASKIAGWVANIKKLIGVGGASGFGLMGLLWTLTAIAAASTIYIVIKYSKEEEKAMENLNDITREISINQGKVNDQYEDNLKLGKDMTQDTKKMNVLYKDTLKNQILEIDTLQDKKNFLGAITGRNRDYKESQIQLYKEIETTADRYHTLFKNGQMTTEQQNDYAKSLHDTIKYMEKNGVEADKLKEHYKELTGKEYKVKITENVSDVKAAINNFVSTTQKSVKDAKYEMNFNNAKKQIEEFKKSKVFSEFKIKAGIDNSKIKSSLMAIFNSMPKSLYNGIFQKSLGISYDSAKKLIASLDVGTGYVPNDQLAMIHKGEAVIPKKFNSREYFGGGSEETNSLLKQLNTTLENKDMNAYISRDIVGQASVDYINYKNRTTGRSVI